MQDSYNAVEQFLSTQGWLHGGKWFVQGLLVVYSSALNIYKILFTPYVRLFLLSFSCTKREN